MISYEVRIAGEVPSEALEELGDVQATTATASTLISGTVPDQASLMGLLARLRALGLDVTELRRLPGEQQGGDEPGAKESG